MIAHSGTHPSRDTAAVTRTADDVPRSNPGARPVMVITTAVSVELTDTSGPLNTLSLASELVATCAAAPAARWSRATSTAVSRATTRASVRAWFHIAAWKPANIRTNSSGASSTTVNDVLPRSRHALSCVTCATSGSGRRLDRLFGLCFDLPPQDGGDDRDRDACSDEPEHLLERYRARVTILAVFGQSP